MHYTFQQRPDISECDPDECDTDYTDGNFTLIEDDAIYEFNTKSIQMPFQTDVFSSNIRVNTTSIFPQKEGFQFAVGFLNESVSIDLNGLFFEFRLVSIAANGTKTVTLLKAETCTAAHFSISSNYNTETPITQTSDDPVSGIKLSRYICPNKTDIELYGHFLSGKSQYIDIVQKNCDNTTSTTCMGSLAIYNLYRYGYMEFLFIESKLTKYGNVIRRATTKNLLPAHFQVQFEYYFEIIPNYVTPGGNSTPYTFYEVELEVMIMTNQVLPDRYLTRIHMSNTYKNHWRQEVTVPDIRKTATPYVIEDPVMPIIETVDLMPDLYLAFYIMSQIGGLMYFLKIVFTPMLAYFNFKINKHALVNAWLEVRKYKFGKGFSSVSS